MATSSILGGSRLPEEISGKDVHALGPSDNSDSGSDAAGAYGDDELASDTDAAGTGERASVGRGGEQADADILPDRIEAVTDLASADDLEDLPGDDAGAGDVRGLEDIEDLDGLDAAQDEARGDDDEEAGPRRKA